MIYNAWEYNEHAKSQLNVAIFYSSSLTWNSTNVFVLTCQWGEHLKKYNILCDATH